MLIILRGVSNSGKDTFAYNNFPPHTIIGSDNIRKMLNNSEQDQRINGQVFKLLAQIVDQRMDNGCPLTVVNATNLKYKDCEEYIKVARKYLKPTVVLSFTPPPIEELVKRNEERYKKDSSKVNVPTEVIQRQINTYHTTTPRFEEEALKSPKDFSSIFISQDYRIRQVDFVVGSVQENVEAVLQNISGDQFHYGWENSQNLFFIGDVHGCLTELKELIAKVENVYPNAKFILAGDLIDRGKDSIETLIYLSSNQHKIKTLLGNHELNFIRELSGAECRSKERAKTHEEFRTFSMDLQFLAKGVLSLGKYVQVVEDMDTIYLFTHSPCKALLEMEWPEEFDMEWFENYIYSSLTDKMLCMSGEKVDTDKFIEYSDSTKYKIKWFHGHQSFFYTDIYEQIKAQENNKHSIYNVDSGAVYGGKLTAMNIKTNEIFQVDLKGEAYEQ